MAFVRGLGLGVSALLVLLSCPALLPATDLETGLRAYHDGNYSVAAKSLLPLAKEGDQEAQFAVGVMCSQGRGFELDYAEAAAWFLEAAKQGICERASPPPSLLA